MRNTERRRKREEKKWGKRARKTVKNCLLMSTHEMRDDEMMRKVKILLYWTCLGYEN